MLSTVSLRNVPVVLRVGPWLAGLALAVSGCNRSAARGKEVAPAAASAAHVETVVTAALGDMVAGAASHYCLDHTSFGGIVIPTLGWAALPPPQGSKGEKK